MLVVLVSFLVLVAGLYTAWKTAAAPLTLWTPVVMFALGVLVPVAYNGLVKKQPLSEIGIRKKYWLRSLALGLILSALVYVHIVTVFTLPPFTELLPLVTFEIMAGFFFTMFFSGWAQMRFEKAFGALPAIFIAAAFFALHHVGYGEPISFFHTLPPFIGGIIFATVFRITQNILILWPFSSTCSLSNELRWGCRLPFESTYVFVGVLVLMWLSIAIVHWRLKKRGTSK